MKKFLNALVIIIACVGAVIITRDLMEFKNKSEQLNIFGTEYQRKYTLYIGLSDGDTQEQKFTFDEAKQIMYDISRKFTSGYTLYDARGYWYEEEANKMFSENTLVCVLFDIDPENVKNIMDEAIKAFNQNSILLEVDTVRRAFYSKEK